MPLNDWELAYNGLTFGGDNDVAVVSVEGLAALPELRTSDTALLRRHGLHAGDDFLGARTVTITMEVYAANDAALAATWQSIAEAFRPGQPEQALTFRIPGIAGGDDARLYCRPRHLAAPVDLSWRHRLYQVAIQLVATDPRIYADSEQGQTVTLPSAGGGLSFNLGFNFGFGAVSTGGTINALNAGSFDTPVVFRIDGPAVNPRIENVTLGRTIAVDITLATGEFLLIDTATRTVLLGGTASRYSSLNAATRWFDLDSGVNELRFSASTSTAATLTATWRSAWV